MVILQRWRYLGTKGAKRVGRFSVEFEVANYGDLDLARRGGIPDSDVRRLKISGLVDPGASMLVLPQAVVEQLGLPMGAKTKVRYADGRRAVRRQAHGVFVKILDRDTVLPAVVEPKRDTALIGAMVLEALDLLVDNGRERLIPRDPEGPIYEIE